MHRDPCEPCGADARPGVGRRATADGRDARTERRGGTSTDTVPSRVQYASRLTFTPSIISFRVPACCCGRCAPAALWSGTERAPTRTRRGERNDQGCEALQPASCAIAGPAVRGYSPSVPWVRDPVVGVRAEATPTVPPPLLWRPHGQHAMSSERGLERGHAQASTAAVDAACAPSGFMEPFGVHTPRVRGGGRLNGGSHRAASPEPPPAAQRAALDKYSRKSM